MTKRGDERSSMTPATERLGSGGGDLKINFMAGIIKAGPSTPPKLKAAPNGVASPPDA